MVEQQINQLIEENKPKWKLWLIIGLIVIVLIGGVFYFVFQQEEELLEQEGTDTEELKKQTLKLIKKIESTTTCPCNKSPLCSWCEYKPICPAWNSKINFEKQKKLNI